ncbi:MAG: hypothetical protein N2B04_07680 [Psychrobacter sp.]
MSNNKPHPIDKKINIGDSKKSNLDRNSDMPTTDVKPSFITINEGRSPEANSQNNRDNSYMELIVNKKK